MGVELSLYHKLMSYVDEISRRASGKKKTNARETRDLVHSHPAYKHDSIVNEEVVYDIVRWYAELN
jgi:glutamate--cysteine ligase catalytic subunit